MPADPTLWRKLSLIPMASHKVKTIEIPDLIFQNLKKFPEKSKQDFPWLKNDLIRKILKKDPQKYFSISKSKRNFFNNISLKSDGNNICFTFSNKDTDKAPRKRTLKTDMVLKKESHTSQPKKMKGRKKKPKTQTQENKENEEKDKNEHPEKPVIGVDPGRSRLCGYYGERGKGTILNPRPKKFTAPTPLIYESARVYTSDKFTNYISEWKRVREEVYEEGRRMKWRYLRFDNKRRKERRFSEALKILLESGGVPVRGKYVMENVRQAVYVAMGDAAFPSVVRRQRCGTVSSFREWLSRKSEVIMFKVDEFNTSKFSSCCSALTIQTLQWESKICTGCGRFIHRDLSAAENIRRKGMAMLWPGSCSYSECFRRPDRKKTVGSV
ncbi:hypothetical protein RCL1_003354 [Eukaryota sp. TZLM3-RCL]